MILGRPWLKEAKKTHNWGDNIFTIIAREKIVVVNTF
jgi:hypothetical protein